MTRTEVVNVRVAHIRPEYKNLKEWCEDIEKNVYIGRGGIVFVDGSRYPPQASVWANPFKLAPGASVEARQECVERYKAYIVRKLGDCVDAELRKLVGKRLGCWCAPEQCHGHVILELMRERGVGQTP